MPAGPAPTTATSYKLEGVAGVRAEAMLCCTLSLLLAWPNQGVIREQQEGEGRWGTEDPA